MKVLVPIKRTIDYTVHIQIKPDHSGIETANVKMSMNPFDEIAVEEAVRLKEKGIATEVVAVSIGPLSSQETLRTALAIGADRALLIETAEELQPLSVAKTLQTIVAQESPQLIILGKQAIDQDNNQTGQLLAGLLKWAQGTFVSKIEVENNTIRAVREIDGGLETLLLNLPAVITTDLRLNQPRYLSLPNIVQSKKKPLAIVPLATLQVDTQPRLQVLKVHQPKRPRKGIKVTTVKELLHQLKNEVQGL